MACASDITVSQSDITLVKLNDDVNGIKKSLEEIRTALKTSQDVSFTVTEKINAVEQDVLKLKKNYEELSEIRQKIGLMGNASDEKLSRFDNSIRANEDMIKIVLDDVYRLKEDLAAGRRPSVLPRGKKPFREYLPYISIGLSVTSLIIAVSH